MQVTKTPGLDGIPAEVYKYGGSALHVQLLKFYRICWTAAVSLTQVDVLDLSIIDISSAYPDISINCNIEIIGSMGVLQCNPAEAQTS